MEDKDLATPFSKIAQQAIPGAELVAFQRLQGGVSAVVHSLDLATPSGPQSIVVRQHPSADWKGLGDGKRVAEKEYAVLTALRQERLEVPQPILVDITGSVLPLPYLVMAKVPGTTTISSDHLDDALTQLATFLAKLHACNLANLTLPGVPPREDPVSGLLEYLPSSIDVPGLQSVVSSYRCATERSCLLHGDYWPGNVLWENHQLKAVLDWEDAAVGPAASDVACCRAELNVLFGRPSAKRFTEIYRRVSEAHLADLTLWDLYVSSAALATLDSWGLPAAEEAQRRSRTTDFALEAARALAD